MKSAKRDIKGGAGTAPSENFPARAGAGRHQPLEP